MTMHGNQHGGEGDLRERAHRTADFDTMRQAMVSSQLRTAAVSDPRVIAAMARVPREAYLRDDLRAVAYRDTAIPLGGGRALNTPMATGRLLTEAYLRREDRVLLIGAATGYGAAILAELVAHVVAVESDPRLADLARTRLTGMSRAELVEGPLAKGHGGGAPYDVLMIDGAVAYVPDALVAQVAPGGRVVAGLAERGLTRLAAGRRTAGGFALVSFADAECVVLPGFDRPEPFRF